MPDWDSDATVFSLCRVCGDYFEHDDFTLDYDSRSMTMRVRSRTAVCPFCLDGSENSGPDFLDDDDDVFGDNESGF